MGFILDKEGNYIPVLGETSGGGSVTVDDELSTSSENPVQNKVITTALNNVSNAWNIGLVSFADPDTYAQGEHTIDVSSIIPADNHQYEAWVSVEFNGGNWHLCTPQGNSKIYWLASAGDPANWSRAYGIVVFDTTNRTLLLEVYPNDGITFTSLTFEAYRKIV